jgi:hypothetical protein
MLHRIHQRLGTAGFVISIIALIAALCGGAYAASGGLTGKQKKEVKKIAKQFAGTPGAPGAAGTPGSNGTNGKDGAPGKEGVNVTFSAASEADCPAGGATFEAANGETTICNGKNGTDGTSPIVVQLEPKGPENCAGVGGAKIVAGGKETFVCNGSGGGGGEYPDTLPEGKTETGVWQDLGENGETLGEWSLALVSYPLRLATPPKETVLIDSESSEEDRTKCPGQEPEPTATPGVLCLYLGGSEGTVPVLHFASPMGGVGMSAFLEPKTTTARGTWAVMAE